MISALLSNTSISNLRGSGLAGDAKTAADEQLLERGGDRARQSLAAPAAVARQGGNVVPLSAAAIIALQESEKPSDSGRQPGGSAASTDSAAENGQSETANADPTATNAKARGAATDPAVTQAEDEDGGATADDLSEEEEKQVRQLAQRDREVRAHEQAHARVGGAYAGAPSYSYQQGPDGKRYAIGGEVAIDSSSERTPDATIRKMQIVIRAATAPAEPSSQDLRVAQQARATLAAAQAEKRQEQAESLTGEGEDGSVVAVPKNNQTNSGAREADTPTSSASTDSNRGQDEPGRSADDRIVASASYAKAAQQAAGALNGQAADLSIF